jgi:putative spermidine/putrescine transport system substrate-binding protein
MASAWNTRIWELDLAESVRVQWFGGMLSADSWVVPKGAPNADIAMDFVNFATRAVPSANFGRLVPFGPVNKDALSLLRPDRAAVLPSAPANKAVQFVQNWNYWADNRDALTTRFEDWLQTKPEQSASPTVQEGGVED